MNADSKLSLKCPSCGNTHQKTLAAIKAQTIFNCECGYKAEIQPKTFLGPRSSEKMQSTSSQGTPDNDDTIAITA